MTNERNRGPWFFISIIALLILFICMGAASLLAPTEESRETAVAPNAPNNANLSEQGILITHVVPHSPAANAGLRRGNIILQVDGASVDDPLHFQQLIQLKPTESEITLTILNGDSTKELAVFLNEATPRLGVDIAGPKVSSGAGYLGATISGVYPNSPAAEAELQTGDVITAVDGKIVLSGVDAAALLDAKTINEAALFTIQRGAERFDQRIILSPHPDNPEKAWLGVDLQ